MRFTYSSLKILKYNRIIELVFKFKILKKFVKMYLYLQFANYFIVKTHIIINFNSLKICLKNSNQGL